MPDRRSNLSCAALLAFMIVSLSAGPVHAKKLEGAELDAVEQRLAPVRPYAAKMAIEAGGTMIIERTVEVPAKRLKKKPTDYEAVVTGVVAPKGVVVHPRMDSFEFTPAGKKVKVTFRYVVHVDPGTTSGGRARMTLALVERTGFANTIHKAKVKHWFDVKMASPSPEDLSADFWGYRHFRRQMIRSQRALKRVRLSGLSTQDNARLPSLDRLRPKAALVAFAFVRQRMRVWSSHRHLVTALQSPNPQIAGLARSYLANLNKKDDALTDLPNVPIIAGAAVAEAPPPTPATIETLEAVAESPASSGSSGTSGGSASTIAPVGAYEYGSDGDPNRALPESSRPRPEPAPPPAPVVAKPGDQPKAATNNNSEDVVVLSDDLLATRQLRNVTYIPGYYRSLTLDDPNIAHGGSVRLAWANVRLREAGVASAVFYNAQVALTRDVGVELTVPTEYVNLDIDGARAIYVMGNPLVAAKYRLYLPEVEGRKPVLTIRGRWAVPVTPLNRVPPTKLGAEDFSREAHFADTYAFFLEKTAIGLGANAAYQWEWLYIGLQLYFDYFLPVQQAEDQTSFATISYGSSIGALPFGEIVGFFLEARAVSLIVGPRRTEFFTYLGARGKFLDFIEPALWIGHPLGSVANVSGFQFGAEIRFSYDLEAILDSGKTVRRQDNLLE